MDINIQITRKGIWDHVVYDGPINEDSEVHLAPLVTTLATNCIFNFRKVAYVNSCGVRAWINFMRVVEARRRIVFEECVPEIVMQMNMTPSFMGSAKIKSVYASFRCDDCGHSRLVLFEDGRNMPTADGAGLTPIRCDKCNRQDMDMEEFGDEFFTFLVPFDPQQT